MGHAASGDWPYGASGTVFSPTAMQARIELTVGPDGEVDGLIVRQGGQRVPARKIG